MTILVCLDDEHGMMFHQRRQSRDRVVLGKLTEFSHHRTLWMSRYSAAMFDDASAFCVDDGYDERMANSDACFVEDGTLDLTRADELIVYRWNRRYPADRRFPIEALTAHWELISSQDMRGFSHERITEERYRRKE